MSKMTYLIFGLIVAYIVISELKLNNPFVAPQDRGRWEVISGDKLILEGKLINLWKLSCPKPNSEIGFKAKELAVRYLSNAPGSCRTEIRNGVVIGNCYQEGSSPLREVLIASGYCQESLF